ncbi:MAG: hypothetical protein HY952_10420 [Elusimicrobia bacterium]|nr:hypothetical protein [Elusimicrobiota bacterium]
MKRSLTLFLAVSALSAGLCRAGSFEDALSISGTGLMARTVEFSAPAVSAPAPAPARAFELYCAGGKLQVQFKDAVRYTAIVKDAAITAALKAAAAKFYEGEQRLVNVRFNGPASFMVADFQKDPDGYGYDAGQFAPKLRLLGGGRARLTLTYFRMTNSHAYEFNEVASFDFDGCLK